MSLDMIGFIDDCFESVDSATRTPQIVGRDAYNRPTFTAGTPTSHRVNLQPVDMKEIVHLDIGGRRIEDYRVVHVNDGITPDIAPNDEWVFSGVDGVFSCLETDNRPKRNYCRLIVVRNDEQ